MAKYCVFAACSWCLLLWAINIYFLLIYVELTHIPSEERLAVVAAEWRDSRWQTLPTSTGRKRNHIRSWLKPVKKTWEQVKLISLPLQEDDKTGRYLLAVIPGTQLYWVTEYGERAQPPKISATTSVIDATNKPISATKTTIQRSSTINEHLQRLGTKVETTLLHWKQYYRVFLSTQRTSSQPRQYATDRVRNNFIRRT